ncbi:hypothetical protein P280DRAFT_196971 [Massarina eburnea CBS 473.64]|uniref:Uncharacterized protein n=1 Tax=Massarina eburnea CBS 473.64 TaxID=1395130 RepID=A0A6A6RJY9_9PLEO|nr:hypothetical protein P280DRAFT_196971 [Massarina eburnea CBS 473.64]
MTIFESPNARPRTPAEGQQIAGLNQRKSPFLRLPAELRNIIYIDVLSHHIIIPDSRHIPSRYNDSPPHRFALLFTCHQIHTETQLLPFEHGRVVLYTSSVSFHVSLPQPRPFIFTAQQISAIKWLELRTDSRSSIGDLQFMNGMGGLEEVTVKLSPAYTIQREGRGWGRKIKAIQASFRFQVIEYLKNIGREDVSVGPKTRA